MIEKGPALANKRAPLVIVIVLLLLVQRAQSGHSPTYPSVPLIDFYLFRYPLREVKGVMTVDKKRRTTRLSAE